MIDVPRLQARNSAAFWTATGRARGHEVIRRRGYLAVAGDARAGLRILIQEPDLRGSEIAEITELVRDAPGPVDAEDPFSATSLHHLGLQRSWHMPVMLRRAGAVEQPATDVIRVHEPDDLWAAEQAVIAAFGLTRFEPYRPGELFPLSLLDEPGVAVFVARIDGVTAGACVSVVHDGLGSHYWVATPSAFRSRGVGRAVMLASLVPLADLTVTLTASRLGRPLYESLGFAATTDSTWWASS